MKELLLAISALHKLEEVVILADHPLQQVNDFRCLCNAVLVLVAATRVHRPKLQEVEYIITNDDSRLFGIRINSQVKL